jgi:hypothetical protein
MKCEYWNCSNNVAKFDSENIWKKPIWPPHTQRLFMRKIVYASKVWTPNGEWDWRGWWQWFWRLRTAKPIQMKHFWGTQMIDLSFISGFHLTIQYQTHQPPGWHASLGFFQWNKDPRPNGKFWDYENIWEIVWISVSRNLPRKPGIGSNVTENGLFWTFWYT